MKQFVYALVRSQDGNDSSEQFCFACLTVEQADHCAGLINGYLARLSVRLPMLPNDVDHPDWDQLDARRTAMLKKVRWPFGIDLQFDLYRAGSKVIEVRPLPVRSPRLP